MVAHVSLGAATWHLDAFASQRGVQSLVETTALEPEPLDAPSVELLLLQASVPRPSATRVVTQLRKLI
jgi:hypothetical protein